jgi:hypothetical protein
MANADVKHVLVPTINDIPGLPERGALYFVKDKREIYLDSGDGLKRYGGKNKFLEWLEKGDWPDWRKNPNEQVGEGWAAFSAEWQSMIDGIKAATLLTNGGPLAVNTITPRGDYPGNEAFSAGTLLPDGRVLLVPKTAGLAPRIFDPVSEETTISTAVYPEGIRFSAGVLLPDDRVLLIPYGHATDDVKKLVIYDPAEDTIGISNADVSAYRFSGGVLLPDGRVFLTAYSTGYSCIYDLETDTVSGSIYLNMNTTAENLATILLPDERILGVYGKQIYNPQTSGVVTANYPGTHVSAVLLPDGRMLMIPFAAGYLYIYDPVNNTSAQFGVGYSAVNGFTRGVLLPDGRVFLVPSNATKAKIVYTNIHKPGMLFSTSPYFSS